MRPVSLPVLDVHQAAMPATRKSESDSMSGAIKSVFVLCLLCGAHSSALAQTKHSEARGELLYAAHCIACHASEVHWREQKLATGWNSLKAQVRRWQASIGLIWSEEEITDVARYLNAVYYDFSDTDQKDFSQGKKPRQILREY